MFFFGGVFGPSGSVCSQPHQPQADHGTKGHSQRQDRPGGGVGHRPVLPGGALFLVRGPPKHVYFSAPPPDCSDWTPQAKIYCWWPPPHTHTLSMGHRLSMSTTQPVNYQLVPRLYKGPIRNQNRLKAMTYIYNLNSSLCSMKLFTCSPQKFSRLYHNNISSIHLLMFLARLLS